MQKTLVVLFATAALAAAGVLDAINIMPDEKAVPYSEEVVRVENTPSEPAQPQFIIGKMDTVGGTTYDWFANGPSLRMITNASGYGVHVVWMYSASSSTTFPDRNMRYNFYDYAMRSWTWIDPDFMTSGVNVFTDRSGYGSLGTDPATGVAVVSRHYGGTTLNVGLARDMAPGGGIFEYCAGPVCLWPAFDMDGDGWVQMAVADANPMTTLLTTRSTAWCNILSPQSRGSYSFPTYNIAASRISKKVCLTSVPSTGPTGGSYYISTDGGATWGGAQALAAPAAYGRDTTPSFHITGLFPYYDRYDRLHIVGAVMPYVGSNGYVIPADIWHWSPDNSPNWSRIQRATGNLTQPVGYNAILACRPTMGEDQNGNLYVAWEQFDPANGETRTSRLRADIWYSRSTDNGKTWATPLRITDPNTTSKRFPSIIDKMEGDTLFITYLQDQIAGFFVMGEGAVTNNPIIVHKVPVQMVGMEEGRNRIRVEELSVQPNPAVGRTQIRYALPAGAGVQLNVYDLAGRNVAKLERGYQDAGRYEVNWHAEGVSPGIYLVELKAGARVLVQKLVLQ